MAAPPDLPRGLQTTSMAALPLVWRQEENERQVWLCLFVKVSREVYRVSAVFSVTVECMKVLYFLSDTGGNERRVWLCLFMKVRKKV
jgi:hypothetical protein